MEEIGLDIIKNCQNGSAEAFATVVERYEKPIFSFLYKLTYRSVNREEIEDLVQEVFLKAYYSIRTFDAARRVKFSTWLYTIARNHFISFWRKQSGDVRVVEDDISELHSVADPKSRVPRDEVLDKELSEKVAEAIAQLPEKQKSALLLQYYEGLSYEEIAEIMNCSVGTVKSRLARAREKLYQSLREYV